MAQRNRWNVKSQWDIPWKRTLSKTKIAGLDKVMKFKYGHRGPSAGKVSDGWPSRVVRDGYDDPEVDASTEKVLVVFASVL